MKIQFKKTGLLLFGILLFNGCTGQPNLPKITEQEILKYENQYLEEYQKNQHSYKNNSVIKWIQPTNKQVACKVFVGVSKKEDRTKDDEYKIFWDGQCKNGYAYGLGREFERGTLTNMNALAIYSGKKEQPKYYINKYNLDNVLMEGDLNNDYGVRTRVEDDGMNFNISYEYGFFGSSDKPTLMTYSTPFQDNIFHLKGYPNFAYKILDLSNNEFNNIKYVFSLINSDKKENGFGFEIEKNGSRNSGEIINGELIRRVLLPQSYITRVNNIYDEIKQTEQKALNAQKKALLVKKQYKKRICRDSIRVNFMDNTEYKDICQEHLHYKNLKKKIDTKLAQINQQKVQKRQQMQQERLIQARESEARASHRQARASESANFQRTLDNISRSSQNNTMNMNLQNTNFQLQQMNNYLRYGY